MGIREVEVAGQKLTIHELDDVYDSLTGCTLTGSWLWNSAFVLSEWMATQLDFKYKSVIELGAGAGLPGLIAARLGASRVVLTDIGSLLPGLKENVEANGLKDRVEVRELEWGSTELLSQGGELEKFDVVLMSDVFYDPEEMARLALTLGMVCGEETRILAACEVRPWTCECLGELASRGFWVVEFPNLLRESCSPLSDGDGNVETFAVYYIAKPCKQCTS
ncbi:protein N-lysine methyltransferase METTL21A-like [Tripterygium wilfordii]|uniref:Protein N-lysine methyltransferase METTL21A-like n=1 Tax=Tripterygium wilfordii TaxID=458696 RepID=A0A7J7C6B5_TRIWF|nr:protein N-lysine methyltransferase METTL21A-like [Tripterygium wilfordii]KAF5729668.1 protein N-lysine methyltransferase METTL21A-like [Tripterygium wilfordii]